jgi:AcrR family transcriptional regulator
MKLCADHGMASIADAWAPAVPTTRAAQPERRRTDMAEPRPTDKDRRVRRTERALTDAFVALVIERGYDKVSVEDITERADVARATFYSHYSGKEELLTSVFSKLVDEAHERFTIRSGPWDVVRTSMVEESFKHAGELQDLYRVCLSGAADGRARRAYVDAIVKSAEANFSSRAEGLGSPPRVPVDVMATAFAGAHTALLEAWISGRLQGSAHEMAIMELELLVQGFAWAHGLAAAEMSFDAVPGPDG